MELANENRVGLTKGTAVEEAVEMNFKGETSSSSFLSILYYRNPFG